MQRIWITGSSGSGKTTLARKLAARLDIPVYHRDRITWMENWKERSEKEQIRLVKEIAGKEEWIFEGNRFTASREDGRLENCDTLIHINMNRFLCLFRGLRRYFKHRNNQRAELAAGCDEDYDWQVVKYVLFQYPKKKKQRQRFFQEVRAMGKQVIELNGRKEVKEWLEKQERCNFEKSC